MKKNETKVWKTTGWIVAPISMFLFIMPYLGLPFAIFGMVCGVRSKNVGMQVLSILSMILNGVMLFLVLIFLMMGLV